MFDWFTSLHSWTFETIVQPALYRSGFMNWDERAYEGTELFLIGILELLVLYAVLRPLEMFAPVEVWNDRSETRVDVLYAMLAKLGVVPLFLFVVLTPAFVWINGNLRMNGIIPPNLEDLLPSLKDAPVLSAVVYLVILDFADYWRHRLQHRFGVWWAIHSLHHSQRQMTFWTDDREHLLDQVIAGFWRASISLAIGVPPAQFLEVTLVSAAIESLSHANVKLDFGWLRWLIVSPRFHRVHHAVAIGYEGAARGCNFAQVFAVWDVLFRTANFEPVYPPTGVDDDRDYGHGFLAQQWLGFRRILEGVMG